MLGAAGSVYTRHYSWPVRANTWTCSTRFGRRLPRRTVWSRCQAGSPGAHEPHRRPTRWWRRYRKRFGGARAAPGRVAQRRSVTHGEPVKFAFMAAIRRRPGKRRRACLPRSRCASATTWTCYCARDQRTWKNDTRKAPIGLGGARSADSVSARCRTISPSTRANSADGSPAPCARARVGVHCTGRAFRPHRLREAEPTTMCWFLACGRLPSMASSIFARAQRPLPVPPAAAGVGPAGPTWSIRAALGFFSDSEPSSGALVHRHPPTLRGDSSGSASVSAAAAVVPEAPAGPGRRERR